jgi:hypothetical protein
MLIQKNVITKNRNMEVVITLIGTRKETFVPESGKRFLPLRQELSNSGARIFAVTLRP